MITVELLVAATLWFEAGGESREGIAMVADVIWNRVTSQQASGLWEVKVAEACLAPKQFSCWNDCTPHPRVERRLQPLLDKPPNAYSWLLCKELAERIVRGTHIPRSRATHYYAWKKIAAPYWCKHLTEVATEGGHKFFA